MPLRGRPPVPRAGPRGVTGPVPRGSRAWLPYLAILGCVAAVALWLWAGGTHAAKGGTLALAGAMAVAALVRLALPESRAGLLASRKRVTDVVTLGALAAGLLAAGILLPGRA
jgi:Protein of unknown function (DUF3017)